LQDQLNYFKGLPCLELAIEAAALSIDGRGKRLRHQQRLTRSALAAANENLLSEISKIRDCRSFEQLLSLVDKSLHEISGLGELYVYDTTLRIGAYSSLWPEHVYLHAGTRKGARALGFSGKVSRVDPVDFPTVIQQIRPHEIEDFLCIYKAELRKLVT
jgi:hypothetical protein